MDYNTQRSSIILPEYGRNIQKMIEHLKTIDDKAERTNQAKAIYKVMTGIMPGMKDTEEYKTKIWGHLYIMSNFDLDIDFPFPVEEKQTENTERKVPAYNQSKKGLNSYGRLMIEMINEIIKYEGEDKDKVILAVANQMKKLYVEFNKNSVPDKVIITDLKKLSNGKLTLPEDTTLVFVKETNNSSNTNNSKNQKLRNPKKKQSSKMKFS